MVMVKRRRKRKRTHQSADDTDRNVVVVLERVDHCATEHAGDHGRRKAGHRKNAPCEVAKQG
jgi:hypothetical protein